MEKTVIKLVYADTLGGLIQVWRIIYSPNRFVINREFVTVNGGKGGFEIGWNEEKPETFKTWKEFQDRWGLGEVIPQP